MKKIKRDWKTAGGYVMSVAIFACVLTLFLGGVMFFSRKAGNEGADTLKNGIRRASVQCYAIEGRYPPSVAYLEENYGIKIDRSRYNVFYDGFASNIMPDITVVRIEH